MKTKTLLWSLFFALGASACGGGGESPEDPPSRDAEFSPEYYSMNELREEYAIPDERDIEYGYYLGALNFGEASEYHRHTTFSWIRMPRTPKRMEQKPAATDTD